MRFYTSTECEEWCRAENVSLDSERRPHRALPNQHLLHCSLPPKFTQFLWFSRCIESALQPRHDCLLWVTASDIWRSSENHHLYYRLRQSYNDHRLLHDAPGHLCLDYERAEVVSLIYLAILFGWDVHLIPTVGYGRAFISHDEEIAVGLDDPTKFGETTQALEGANISFTPNPVT